MFNAAAGFYDALYSFKDYAAEAVKIAELAEAAGVRHPRATLLDVGCGAGEHLVHLKTQFDVAGVDIDEKLIERARTKLPGVPLVVADMAELSLGRRFDFITCLYGSIAYTETLERMREAVQRFAQHLTPGGVIVLQPWYRSAAECPRMQVRHVDLPEIKIARLSRTTIEGCRARIDVHYLVGQEGSIEHLQEEHRLGVFSHAEHLASFDAAGVVARCHDDALGPGLHAYVAAST